MINSCYSGFYTNISSDKRIDKRMGKVLGDLIHSGSSIINKSNKSHTPKTATYRILNNKRIDYKTALEGSFRRCAENIDVTHVLCIQDTTEFNLAHLANKIGEDDSDIGPTTNKNIAGFFCHPVIVCDPSGEAIYGLSSASVYNRTWGQKDKYQRDYPNLPIEQKESYRWIENALNTRALIPENIRLTIVGDRESDIYEEFVEVANANADVLVRSRANRNLVSGTGKLYAELDKQLPAGTIQVDLQGNRSRDKRTAQIEVRFCKVELKAPKKYNGTSKSLSIYAVEAKEVTPNLPKGQKPIMWRLLTTHTIENFVQAKQCIEWYKQRWLIEELFRVIKTKGFQIESTQLGNGSAIKKLLAFTLEAALQVMRLKLALDKKKQTKASLLFSEKQIILLTLLRQEVEGETAKQKNPYPIKTMAWAAWIIARLGNWTGYKSHGPPGYITMKNGYDTFHAQYRLFEILNAS
jgi:hypothetical protein